jgi:hypothetical protein
MNNSGKEQKAWGHGLDRDSLMLYSRQKHLHFALQIEFVPRVRNAHEIERGWSEWLTARASKCPKSGV